MRNENAVVCGASIAGLFAARVLSDFYDAVTVVERDKLPEGPSQRRGVSQGRHLHQMLSRGVPYIVDLFPGLLEELEAAGAIVLDSPDDPALFHLGVGDIVFCRSGRFTRSEGTVVFLASRPLLEGIIRRRVRSITNVTFMDGHDVAEMVIGPAGRVTGARVVERATGQELVLTTDLVIDTTGRSARTPAFLEANGYQRPPERRYTIDLSYSSQFFRLAPGTLAERAVLEIPTLDRPEGFGLLPYENGTVIATVIGFAGRKTPKDLPGLLDSISASVPNHVAAALRTGEPIGEVSTQRYPASVWRCYHKLTRFPPGLLVMGDAVCSLNPVYGQGMTSAALQASALQTCISDGSDQLSLRFFRACAETLSPMWRANRFFDFTIVPSDGWQSKPKKFISLAMGKLYVAAATDVVITEALFRQMQLLEHPKEFLRPSLLRRIVAGNRLTATNE
ncbi:FAD-dependent oxidoreductase [Mycobacterium vicinigordonae]|uniref:2-polyprenyl-6-methoxyphenol hydroxylase-like oxidoreductase n=1 Tax=Mycobacterium vicinigordonae TaxID=1719132 RepID=A0A7D6DWL5_9MYCO|nr:2-polyprenyl-6-methoxyphenol hydroxylase-like oxidoreductase [Mycobacterium vicinigordonae]QLL06584.1 2-polyprenyl-6-methoxyphenol hydroxylase-like oxidoreductase [Mycobacterium vicinigordonae]